MTNMAHGTRRKGKGKEVAMIGKQLCCFIVKLSRICLAALQTSEKKRISHMIRYHQLRSQEDARLRELGIQEDQRATKAHSDIMARYHM